MRRQIANTLFGLALFAGGVAVPAAAQEDADAGAIQDQTSTMGATDMMGMPGYGGYGGMMGPGMGMGAGGCPGMAGPGMMGPGMMGMGSGMMGGMMGLGPIGMLDLTQEQQRKINAIQDRLRKEHWNLRGQILDQQARMRDLYAAEQPDPKKIGEVYGNIAQVQRQMLETRVQAQNQIRDVLTPEQQQRLSQLRRGAGPGFGGPGMGGGMMWNR